MARCLAWLHAFEAAALVSLVAMLVLAAGIQVILRALFDIGVSWLDPLLRATVLWIAMQGALLAARHDSHIAIELLPRFLGGTARRWVRGGSLLFAALVCMLLAWHALAMLRLEMAFPQTAFGAVPSWAVMVIVPLGFALLGLRLGVRAFCKPEA